MGATIAPEVGLAATGAVLIAPAAEAALGALGSAWWAAGLAAELSQTADAANLLSPVAVRAANAEGQVAVTALPRAVCCCVA